MLGDIGVDGFEWEVGACIVITIGLLFLVSDMLSLVVGAMARQVVVRLTCICTTHLRMCFGLLVLVL